MVVRASGLFSHPSTQKLTLKSKWLSLAVVSVVVVVDPVVVVDAAAPSVTRTRSGELETSAGLIAKDRVLCDIRL